jgi:hypothetical protein
LRGDLRGSSGRVQGGWILWRLCCAVLTTAISLIEALVSMLLSYRHLAGETAILIASDGAFGADEAARRHNVIPLNQAFGRLD